MDARTLIGPISLLVASAPLFVLAILVGRGNLGLINGIDPERVVDKQALAARLSRLLSALGMALLAAAGGFVWAGDDQDRVLMITLALVVAISLLTIRMLLVIARARRDYRAASSRGTGDRR
jgi:hypothetical protein